MRMWTTQFANRNQTGKNLLKLTSLPTSIRSVPQFRPLLEYFAFLRVQMPFSDYNSRENFCIGKRNNDWLWCKPSN